MKKSIVDDLKRNEVCNILVLNMTEQWHVTTTFALKVALSVPSGPYEVPERFLQESQWTVEVPRPVTYRREGGTKKKRKNKVIKILL